MNAKSKATRVCATPTHSGQDVGCAGTQNFILLTATAVFRKLNLSHSQVKDLVQAGLLTPPIRLEDEGDCWPEDEIAAILSSRINGATDEEIRYLVKKLMYVSGSCRSLRAAT